MSNRLTAEIVADLRATDVIRPVWTGNAWHVSPVGGTEYRGPSRLAREAADRLDELSRWAPPTGERIPGVPPWQAGRRLS